MTKAQEHFIYSHKRATATRLDDVYDRCSTAKREAYASCWARFQEVDGYDFKIMGANTYSFTCGWFYMHDGKEYMHVETSQKMHDFCIE